MHMAAMHNSECPALQVLSRRWAQDDLAMHGVMRPGQSAFFRLGRPADCALKIS